MKIPAQTLLLFCSLLSLPPDPACAAGNELLWYDKPAANWQEALPVGNGSLGGMIFGGIEREQIQFNEQTLWTGDEIKMGNYQPFGDLFLNFGHASAENYRRELNLDEAVHRVGFNVNGTHFTRETFSNYPDQVMVIHLTADKGGSLNCNLQLSDAHKGNISAAGSQITSAGKLDNGLLYEARVLALTENGRVEVSGQDLKISGADSATLLLAAGTSFSLSFFMI